MTTTLTSLLANLGIIFTLVGIWSLCLNWSFTQSRIARKIAVAIAAAACAMLLMSLPIQVAKGVIFDLRAVPIALSGFFAGPAVGVAVGALTAAYRLGLGGVGAWPAVAGILLTTAVAVAGRTLLGKRPVSTASLILLGGAAAAANLLGPLLLPEDLRWHVMEKVALPTVLVVFIAIVFIGEMIANDLQRRKVVESLRTTEKRLYEANRSLTEMAHIDGLTDIANRRAFDQAIAAEIGRSQRASAPLSLLLLDVDNFKSFNDQYGHLAGDNCLRMIAAIIQSTLRRPGDLVARFGGEEFAILLPGTDSAGAVAVAERIRTAIVGLAIEHEGVPSRIVTVSIGVAMTSGPVEPGTSKELMRQADEALYEAKGSGRDKVMVYDSVRPDLAAAGSA